MLSLAVQKQEHQKSSIAPLPPAALPKPCSQSKTLLILSVSPSFCCHGFFAWNIKVFNYSLLEKELRGPRQQAGDEQHPFNPVIASDCRMWQTVMTVVRKSKANGKDMKSEAIPL